MEIQSRKIDAEIAKADLQLPFDRRPTRIDDTAAARRAEIEAAAAEDDLSDCCRMFEESEEATGSARELSERDRDYYDNYQWTEKELATLRKRGQPALVVNYIKRKVEFMRGYERRQRSDPKAFPRNPQDEQTSHAATDALRYLADKNSFDVIRSNVYENMAVEGYGGVDVTVREKKDKTYEIEVKYVPWDRIFYDPHSRFSDFGDATYKGMVIWMDDREARAKWPGYADSIDGTYADAAKNSSTYDDRPNVWCDTKRKRLRVVQLHYKRGDDWMICTFTKGGFLEPPVVSPYVDEEGHAASSLILRSAYVDRKNNRYGAVRDMISLQDEINKRRSKALHLMSVRQTFGNKSAVQDAQQARVEMAKPDGHVELNAGSKFGEDFGVLPTGDMAQGQVALMQQATMEMQASGPNAAMAGKDPRAQSGRALEAQAQGGSIEQEPLIDELRQWARDVYEAMWLRVKQFWTEETWVRVTDDDRNIKFVGLNKKVTLGDRMAQMAPEMQAAYAQKLGLQPNDPRLQEVVGVDNNVSGLDVDIIVQEGPDVAVLQSEQFAQLADLASKGMAIPPKAIIMASSLRNKDQILDEMEKPQGALPPEVQQQLQEMQQQLQQLSEENKQLKGDRQIKLAELAFKDKELTTKTRIEMAKLGQDAQQPGPDGQPPAPSPKDIADAELKHAQAEKVRAETEVIRNGPMEGEGDIGIPTSAGGGSAPRRAAGNNQQILQALQQLAAMVAAPRTLVYDPSTGEAIAIKQGDVEFPIIRNPDGSIAGTTEAQTP